jgi:quercetin dioxygenase-like cupin family protein
MLLVLAALAGQAAPAPAPSQGAPLPPPYPRPGTTKLLENDIVAVWDVAWLKQQYPLHTHRYDLVGMSYAEGDRIITQGNAPGRLVNTKAWVFQTNRADVTHVEEGASDSPMRAVQIELKKPAPGPPAADVPDGLRHVLGAPSSENNRAAVWAVAPGTVAPTHRHVGDAVEMVFAGTPPQPKVAFVPAGTVHAGPNPGESGRVFIFELK